MAPVTAEPEPPLPALSVDKSPQRVRRMFGEIAGRYDLLNRLLSLGMDCYWRRRTVRLARPTDDGGPILDVCTGTGDLALAYWRSRRGEIPVVGADFSHPMLAIAKKKARRAGAQRRLRFVEADTLRLPFADDTFQLVSVAFGLRNVADTDAGLREMTRVLRGGGRLAILEFSMPTVWPVSTIYGWYFRRLLPRIGQALAKNRQGAYNYLPQSVSQFPQREALAERMRQAGLTDVKFHSLTFGVATLYTGVK